MLRNSASAFIPYKTAISFILRFLKVCKGIVKTLLVLVLILTVYFYYRTVIYDFEPSQPFTGSSFYNPYKNWKADQTYKANFHAHSTAWKGATNGHNSPEELLKNYQAKGFAVAAISNYHTLDKTPKEGLINIPVYEHGFNILKSHKLAIGAGKVSYLDFPFWQNTSHKQQIVNEIKNNGGLIALAHPSLRNGHSKEDLIDLQNYDFMEVMSPYANSLSYWDVALSHGKSVWVMANDDTHNLEKEKAGRYFNVLNGRPQNASEVKTNLKSGNFYAVFAPEASTDLGINYISLEQDTILFGFAGEIRKIRAVAEGETLRVFSNSSGFMVFPKSASYVRFEVTGENDLLLTNPIIRSRSGEISENRNTAKVNLPMTILFRTGLLFLALIALLLTFANRPFYRKIWKRLAKPQIRDRRWERV